jgi:hypothetical protein
LLFAIVSFDAAGHWGASSRRIEGEAWVVLDEGIAAEAQDQRGELGGEAEDRGQVLLFAILSFGAAGPSGASSRRF